MNNLFAAKLLQNLRNKKGNKGFTLIELLVVVIIVGVLAAVALPNLLGQVGKAREVEGKNGVGAINRAQQAYHFERRAFNATTVANYFATPTNPLGVVVESQYYDFTNPAASATGNDNLTGIIVQANPSDGTNDGVRGYGGSVAYDNAGKYDTAICQSNAIDATVDPNDDGAGDATCPAGTELEGS